MLQDGGPLSRTPELKVCAVIDGVWFLFFYNAIYIPPPIHLVLEALEFITHNLAPEGWNYGS